MRTFSGRADVLHGADDRRRLGAPQQVAQGEAAGHGVGVRLVVQQDQHPVGVGEVALVLEDAGAGDAAFEFGVQLGRKQLGESQREDVGVRRLGFVGATQRGPGRHHVGQRAAGVA